MNQWQIVSLVVTMVAVSTASAADAAAGATPQASAVGGVPAPQRLGVAAPAPPNPSAPAEAVAVLEFSSTAPVAFAAGVPVFQRRLVLNVAPRREKTVVTVNVGALEGRDGTTYAMTVSNASSPAADPRKESLAVHLEPGQQTVEVRLSAALPQQGDYAGYVSLKLGDEPAQYRPIKVTYVLPELPVQAGLAYRAPSNGFFSAEGAVGIQLSGPSDRDLQAVTVALRDLQRMPSPSERVAAAYSSQFFSVKDTGGVSNSDKNISLTKGVPLPLYLDVSDLSAGSYTGKLSIASPGYKPKEEPVSFVIRVGWFWAFVLVTVGAAISAAIQYYAAFRQPRLLVRDSVGGLEQRLDDLERQLVPDREETLVIQHLRARIDRSLQGSYRATLPSRWLADVQTKLRIVEGKVDAVPDWVRARRALAEVDVPAATRATLQKDLDDIQDAIESGAEMSAAATATLTSLLNKIQAARREALAAPVSTLIAQIDRETNATSSVAARNAFAAANSAASAALRTLTVTDIQAYLANFEEASLAYARGKGLALEANLPTPVTPQWDTVRGLLQQLAGAADARTADALYNQAYDAFGRPKQLHLRKTSMRSKVPVGVRMFKMQSRTPCTWYEAPVLRATTWVLHSGTCVRSQKDGTRQLTYSDLALPCT